MLYIHQLVVLCSRQSGVALTGLWFWSERCAVGWTGWSWSCCEQECPWTTRITLVMYLCHCYWFLKGKWYFLLNHVTITVHNLNNCRSYEATRLKQHMEKLPMFDQFCIIKMWMMWSNELCWFELLCQFEPLLLDSFRVGSPNIMIIQSRLKISQIFL